MENEVALVTAKNICIDNPDEQLYSCPACNGNSLLDEDFHYCPNCGIKLTWDITQEEQDEDE